MSPRGRLFSGEPGQRLPALLANRLATPLGCLPAGELDEPGREGQRLGADVEAVELPLGRLLLAGFELAPDQLPAEQRCLLDPIGPPGSVTLSATWPMPGVMARRSSGEVGPSAAYLSVLGPRPGG